VKDEMTRAALIISAAVSFCFLTGVAGTVYFTKDRIGCPSYYLIQAQPLATVPAK
jgi:hypothetical protein